MKFWLQNTVCIYWCCLSLHVDLITAILTHFQHNDGILDSGSEALTCSFNRRGTLLAVGCNDGRIAIWDFMTRGIARICSGHIHPITSLSWNRSGHKLLSSSTDWNVLLWDIASGEIDLRFRFPSPVLKAQFHPRNRYTCTCTLYMHVHVYRRVGRHNDILNYYEYVYYLYRNVFLVCPMKNAPVLVIKNSSNGEYKHITLPTDGEVGKYMYACTCSCATVVLKNQHL